MNLSLGLGLSSFKSLFGGAGDAWTVYKARVVADGGTVYDTGRAKTVYNEVTAVDTPTLLCTCDAGKAEVLYNIIPAPTGATYLSEVGGMPTAAYSVDRVVDGYYDYVMEVRRTVSAVTVEADVAFDGDTITLDSAVTITSGSSSATTLGEFVANASYSDPDSLGSPQDAFVATWYDQAGSNDATQTTAASQPKIVSAGALVTENGKVALDFDGMDWLVTESAYPTGTNLSHFYVASSTATNNRVLDTRGTGAPGDVLGWHHKFSNPSLQDVTLLDDGLGSYLQIGFISRTGQNLVSIFGSLTSLSEYTNSTLNNSVTGSINSFDSGNQLYFAANVNGQDTQLFTGKMQEVVLYTSDKSALRTAIEGNINGRFSIYS